MTGLPPNEARLDKIKRGLIAHAKNNTHSYGEAARSDVNYLLAREQTERERAEQGEAALSWALDVLEISLRRLDTLEPEPYAPEHYALREAGLAKARAALSAREPGKQGYPGDPLDGLAGHETCVYCLAAATSYDADGMLCDFHAAEREFVSASVAVWQEIDRLTDESGTYTGLPQSTPLRIREKAAWERYREALSAREPGKQAE